MLARTGWRSAATLILTSAALAVGGLTTPASAAPFPVSDLGVLAGGTTSNGTAINDLGVAVGMSDLAGQRTPVRFQAGTVAQLPDCCFGAAAPRALNAGGEAAGTNNLGYATDAVYWDGQGHSVVLPPNPAVATNWQLAYDINGSGTIVGEAVESGTLNRRAVVWQRGSFSRDLGFLGRADAGFVQYMSARGINEAGDIVGDSLFGSTYHAWVNRGGAFTDLGVGRAVDINDAGLVVGHYQTGQPAIWRNGVRTLLPSLAGSTPAYGYVVTDVNNAGDVVGYGPGANGFDTAILWRGGKAIDLGRAGTGQRSRALGINNAGQVIGEGSIVNGGGTIDFVNTSRLLSVGSYAFSVNLISDGGLFDVSAGTLTLNFGGAIKDGTVYDIAADAVLQHTAGGYVFSGLIRGQGAGKVLFNGTTVSTAAGNPATFDFDPGVLEWQYGDWNLTGGLTNVGTIQIVTGNDHWIRGTFDNRGQVIHDGDTRGVLLRGDEEPHLHDLPDPEILDGEAGLGILVRALDREAARPRVGLGDARGLEARAEEHGAAGDAALDHELVRLADPRERHGHAAHVGPLERAGHDRFPVEEHGRLERLAAARAGELRQRGEGPEVALRVLPAAGDAAREQAVLEARDGGALRLDLEERGEDQRGGARLARHVPAERGELGLLHARGPGAGRWITWLLNAHASTRRLPDVALVDSLHDLVRRARYVDPKPVARLIEVVSANPHLTAGDKFIVKRLESLRRVISA